MHSASVVPFAVTAPASDPLGVRLVITDRLEQLHIAPRLLSPAFEAAVRERLAELTQFRHPCFSRVRRVDRLDGGSSLALVSEHAPGARLSQVLAVAERHGLVLDINAALSLVRQLVPAVAALHQAAPGVTCGALSPARIVVTPHARVVITDYVLGSALDQLGWPRERLWRELNILAAPSGTGAARLDRRTDIAQIGAVSLSLVLGRALRADELQALPELLASARETTVLGQRELVAAPLRRWLLRALQLDPRGSFQSMAEVQEGLEDVLSEDGGYVAAPLALEAFLTQYGEHAAAPPSRQHRGTARAATVSAPAADPKGAATPLAPRDAAAAPKVGSTPVAEADPAPDPTVGVTASSVPSADAPAAPIPLSDRTEGGRDAEEPGTADAEAHAPAGDVASATEPHVATSAQSAGRARPERRTPPTTLDTTLGLAASRPAREPSRPIEPEAQGGEQKPDEIAGGEHALPPARRITPGRVALAVCAFIAISEGAYIWVTRAAPVVVASDGSLSIESRPAGATVSIDDRERGTTPLTVRVSAGPHVVALRTPGASRVVPVTIQGGVVHEQYVELAPAPTTGAIDVQSDRAGGRVLVDGQPRGTVPVTIADVAPGEHEVVIETPGGTVRHRVAVKAGFTTSVRPASPVGAPGQAGSQGWVTIAVPFEMQVLEGGRALGTTSAPRLPLAPGHHKLEVASQTLGFRTMLSVDVVAGKETRVPVRLPTAQVAINAIPWAEVWVDGEKAGETPIGSVALTLGPHELIFRHPDFPEQHHAISVAAGEPTRVSVEMRK